MIALFLDLALQAATPDFSISHDPKTIERMVIRELITEKDLPTTFDQGHRWMWFINKRQFSFSCMVDSQIDYTDLRYSLQHVDGWYCSLMTEQKPSLLIEVK
jgi:hypothetical protein